MLTNVSYTCPVSWLPWILTGTCLYVKITETGYTWDESLDICKTASDKSHLISLHSYEEFINLYTIIEQKIGIQKEITFWIGARRDRGEEDWHWEDGSTWTWSGWLSGQPSDGVSQENMCAKSRKMDLVNMSQYQPYWYDVSCDNKYHPHRVLVCVTQPLQREHQAEFWQNFVSLFVLASGVLLILIFVIKSGYSNMMNNTNDDLAPKEIELEDYDEHKNYDDHVCHCEHLNCQRTDQNYQRTTQQKPDTDHHNDIRGDVKKKVHNNGLCPYWLLGLTPP